MSVLNKFHTAIKVVKAHKFFIKQPFAWECNATIPITPKKTDYLLCFDNLRGTIKAEHKMFFLIKHCNIWNNNIFISIKQSQNNDSWEELRQMVKLSFKWIILKSKILQKLRNFLKWALWIILTLQGFFILESCQGYSFY